MRTMTIGTVARHAGVGVETIRFYEKKGLIARPRKPLNGFRDYPADTVTRIRFIRQAQAFGFSLAEIAELLSLRADPRANCADVRARAAVKLDEVKRKIQGLERMAEVIERLVAACRGQGPVDGCAILDAFAADDPEDKPNSRRKEKRNHG